MEEWTHDKPLKWSELPRGAYFFHATPTDRLESIRQSGLTTPDTHKQGKIWDIPFYPKGRVLDRLFLFTTEKDCLLYTEHRKLVALRFKRSEISGASLFKDPGYVDNEIPELKPISFSANVSVPAKALEMCPRIKWDEERERYVALKWVSICTPKIVR